MQLLHKIRNIFDKKSKIKLVILLFAIIGGAILETLALSIISPFISVIMDSTQIQSNKYLSFVFNLLNFDSVNGFLAFLAFSLAFVYVFRGVYLFVLARVQSRFIALRRAELSNELLDTILHKPYVYHANHNVAEMLRIVVQDVDALFALINSILLFLSDSFMSLFIVIFLLVVSPMMTAAVICLSLVCVLVYFKVFRRRIKAVGEETRDTSIEMTKAINQALSGMKEVKISHTEEHFRKKFLESSYDYAFANQKYVVLNQIPKLFIESFCFGGAFIMLMFMLLADHNVQAMVPQLSLFVLAAFRLLPAVSRLVQYVASIVYYMPSVDAVYDNMHDIDVDKELIVIPEKAVITATNRNIEVANISFKYPNSEQTVLENANITIPENKSVAFIGPSGAGKTTLADVILGILIPQKGTIVYNGKSIFDDYTSWAKNIGYIPQQIYMLDETILENIAFGIDKKDIDQAKIWRALEQAQLKDFVESLPDQLETIVGDRGVRLSGGQRQRIGIARALYEDPEILVMDEATSSLDTETETAVMEAIKGLQGSKTMIIVAHRLSTIEHCDVVYRIENKVATRER